MGAAPPICGAAAWRFFLAFFAGDTPQDNRHKGGTGVSASHLRASFLGPPRPFNWFALGLPGAGTIVCGLNLTRGSVCTTATLAARPHLCIYGNIQDEFCPARMSLNTKLPMRLLS